MADGQGRVQEAASTEESDSARGMVQLSAPALLLRGNRGRALCIVLVSVAVTLLIRLDPQQRGIRPWLEPQPILSVAALVIGFVVLSWQLQIQYRNTLEANRRQAQDRLNLDLYAKIAERIEATGTPIVEITNLPGAFVAELIVRRQFDATHVRPSVYFSQLRSRQDAAFRSIMSLMSILETHAIVMPEFAVFRERLADAIGAVNRAVNDFAEAASPFSGVGTAGPIRWPPSEDESKVLNRLADSAAQASLSLFAVVWDLRVEAENYLLGRLFSRKIPPRIPGDQSVRVTTIPPSPPAA